MAFAMLPTGWLVEPSGAPGAPRPYLLPQVLWRDYRMTAIAALLLLFTLAAKLNDENRAVGRYGGDRTNLVAVTYQELQKILGIAPATIGKAISLLESWGAIAVHKQGRSSIYELHGIDVDGMWSKYPQQNGPEKNADPVARFKKLPHTMIGLNALKVYLVLLRLMDKNKQYTTVSYDGITRWTGIRREDVRNALGLLHTLDLVSVLDIIDARHREDRSHRYAVHGLTPMARPRDDGEPRRPTDYNPFL